VNEQQRILVERLKEGELGLNRFLKVDEKKAAFEPEWQEHLYGPEDLDKYPRWGICGKDFLVLIDTDKREMYDAIDKTLPETFEVTSPRRGLPHKYLIVCGAQVPNKILHLPNMKDEKGNLLALGEIRADNYYLVAPGTEMSYKDPKTGEQKTGQYKVTKNVPIARMECQDFFNAVKPYITEGGSTTQTITPEEMAKGVTEGQRHTKCLSYSGKLVWLGMDYSTALLHLRTWNETLCKPPLPDDELTRILRDVFGYSATEKNIRYEESLKGEEKHPEIAAEVLKESRKYPNYQYFCPKDAKGHSLGFKPALVAQWLQVYENFKTDIETGILFHYDGKRWNENGDIVLETLVAAILREENKKCHYNNILHALKGLTYEKITFSKKIACPNGLLDVETQELTENTPEEMPFIAIPTEYVPGSEYPQWREWLNQVMPNPEDQKTLQEWSGYILLDDYRFHKLLYNHGEGRNGKGTWERTIQAVIGGESCSEISLEELDGSHRFALYQLYGKLFNTCSEPTTNRVLQTSILKKATGQDRISAERKGSDKRVEFTNTAKITISANKFPKVKDTTTAFRERRLFLKWNQQYLEGKGQIQYIEKNWIEGERDERKGILCWMLEGLKRLLSQMHFTESKSQEQTEIEFERASDTIGAFLKEMVIFNRNLVITRHEAFDSYKNYCDVLGIDSENDKHFAQRLMDTPRISPGRFKEERAWRGIGLKQIDENGKVAGTLGAGGQKKLLEPEEKEEATGTVGTDGTDVESDNTAENNESSQKTEEEKTRVPNVPSVRSGTIDAYCKGDCANCDTQRCPSGPYSLPNNAKVPKDCPAFKPVEGMPDYEDRCEAPSGGED
jgi:P4 family phage/plasmid primase-like protien